MRAEKSPPRCNGTGEAITNRKEKRMHIHLTPDSEGDARARLEDLLEFHGGTPMWRYMWHHSCEPLLQLHVVTATLPDGLNHPDADKGAALKRITVSDADYLAALVSLGDKVAEAVNFKAAS